MARRILVAIAGILPLVMAGTIAYGLHVLRSPRIAGPAASATQANSSPSPDSAAFQPGDCTSTTGASYATEPLADNFGAVLQIPAGWTREPARPSETQLLVIDGPKSLSHQPTSIEALSLLGYFPNRDPADIAREYYGPSHHLGVPSINVLGAVSHCAVQGESGAFFQYTQGNRGGYLVLFLHANYLYGVRVEGAGGVDRSAISAAKELLGSFGWTKTVAPSR